MSELTKLIPAKEALVAAAPVIFDVTIAPADKKDHAMYLFLAQAREQIDNETDEDSPWHINDDDGTKQRAHKAGMFEYQVFTRAVEIVQNLQTTLAINETELIREMDRRRIDLFPPDGEWKDIEGIIRDLNQGKVGSRATDILRMCGDVGDAYEKAGVTAKDIAEIIQAHATDRGDGTSVLAIMATAGNRVLKDTSLRAEEKQEKLLEIAEKAKELSVNKLEETYRNPLVPRLPYEKQYEDGGGALYVFWARTEDQADLLEGRMADAMIRADFYLTRPVSPGAILKAQAADDWDGLLRAAVLADPACRAVYGMMEAGKGPFDREHFMRYTDLAPREIDHALSELGKYGLATSRKLGTKTIWDKAV
jgi:hypothetical protein